MEKLGRHGSVTATHKARGLHSHLHFVSEWFNLNSWQSPWTGQNTLGKTEIARTAFNDWKWKQKYIWLHAKITCSCVELEKSQKNLAALLWTQILSQSSHQNFAKNKAILWEQRHHPITQMPFCPFSLGKVRKQKLLIWVRMGFKNKVKFFLTGIVSQVFLTTSLVQQNMHLPQIWQVQLGQLVNAEYFSWCPVFSSNFWLNFKIGLSDLVHSLCAQSV